jgi:hypothetical protein
LKIIKNIIVVYCITQSINEQLANVSHTTLKNLYFDEYMLHFHNNNCIFIEQAQEEYYNIVTIQLNNILGDDYFNKNIDKIDSLIIDSFDVIYKNTINKILDEKRKEEIK